LIWGVPGLPVHGRDHPVQGRLPGNAPPPIRPVRILRRLHILSRDQRQQACVLALQLAHLMRYRARAGLDLSVRELLSQLAAIGETMLVYPSTGDRPKARRMTTELVGHQPRLYDTFGLERWAPQSLVIRETSPRTPPASGNSHREPRSSETPASALAINVHRVG
jgi:hypothetical protein